MYATGYSDNFYIMKKCLNTLKIILNVHFKYYSILKTYNLWYFVFFVLDFIFVGKIVLHFLTQITILEYRVLFEFSQ